MSKGTEALVRAIKNPGPSPHWHNQLLRKHRKEWPTLWAAIDKILDEEALNGR